MKVQAAQFSDLTSSTEYLPGVLQLHPLTFGTDLDLGKAAHGPANFGKSKS